ncbi:MAG: hypothetical protein NC251_03755 [Lachnoclostridium sp.]|nr:hypothetical protein [Lachnospira sp.]MCM1247528.1 hypothetical protein [Lachnoclostridium sp.]
MSRRRKKKIPFFRIFYSIFTLTLVLFWAVIFLYVRNCLKIYEAAQPEYVIENLIAQIDVSEGSNSPYFQMSVSRFEKEEDYKNTYLAEVKKKGITYEKAPDSYDAKAPVYHLYAGDIPIAEVFLKETDSRPLMAILTVPEWEITRVLPKGIAGQHSVTITVPDVYTVFINGTAAGGSERTGNVRELEEFQYSAEYTEVPALVEYRIEGLFEMPDIRIQNALQEDIAFSMAEDNTITIDTFQTSEMGKELEEFCLTNAKNYSNFFSRDLEGCVASIKPIRYMFPQDSYYLELAENYRRHDMWMYSGHETPQFLSEKVSNYIVYNEDFFSCEVSFDKKMILTKTGQERHDIHNTRYYYLKMDGNWVIVDMQTVQEEEQTNRQ